MQAIENALREDGNQRHVASLLTQVEVDADDPAFLNPTKFVGPFFSEEEAERISSVLNWKMREDSGRGWRKVVPSPKPIDIVQLPAIQALLNEGQCVIAGGGGGIPVIRDASGYLVGVEAVIDKDRLSALLAAKLGAELYIILTGVPKVALDFGKPTQRWVDRITAAEARQHLVDGQFPPGSMGPKIESALAYIEAGGHEVLITTPEDLKHEDPTTVGTRIVRF